MRNILFTLLPFGVNLFAHPQGQDTAAPMAFVTFVFVNRHSPRPHTQSELRTLDGDFPHFDENGQCRRRDRDLVVRHGISRRNFSTAPEHTLPLGRRKRRSGGDLPSGSQVAETLTPQPESVLCKEF